MKESNLGLNLLTNKKVDKISHFYSYSQVDVMRELAKKHNVTLEEVHELLSMAGLFISYHMDIDKIVFVPGFGKMIPFTRRQEILETKWKNRKKKLVRRSLKSPI
jgi:hypothetical protein